MAAPMDLKVNRDLLFPTFEGYKLSLDKLPSYNTAAENGIYKVELSDEQFSYHHAKLFGVNNHLIQDPWDGNNIYFIDKDWNIIKALPHDTSISCCPAVWTIPDASNQQLAPGKVHAGILLLSEEVGVVCDGSGQVYIVETGSRKGGDEKWKVLLSKTIPEDKTPCLLVDAIEMNRDENHKIECLLVHVTEATPEEKDKYRSQYLTILEWTTFISVDRKSWSVERTRQLVSRKPFSYAALGRCGDGSVTVAGEADFKFTRDSEIPVISDEEKEEEMSDKKKPPPPDYTWTQTQDDVTVQFTVAPGVTKADIYMSVRADSVEFGLKNCQELLKGPLHDRVDTDSCTWTIDGQRVDLYLSKQTEAMWPLVVVGDTRGELVMDPAETAAIHERLASLTSDEMNPDPNRADKPYNSQQLEECDMFPDDNFQLVHIDGNTHKTTHKVNLGGHQWLFNTNSEYKEPPALCLRHDVDGLLWKQESGSDWTHHATFNAFGYVQASKTQRKFTVCPPDCSYVVVADSCRHLYLYRQSTPVAKGNSLRNRKTGTEVKAVAQQQVISLEAVDEILGLQATNEKLFVATNNKLYMIKV